MADAKDCRDNAARCIEMANVALNERMQSLMFEMANMWLKLAAELERSSAFRTRYQPVDVRIKRAWATHWQPTPRPTPTWGRRP
jgi:hypothetical protein